MKKCIYCDDTGIVLFPDGEDDYTKEFCICEKGKEMRGETNEN